MSAVATAEPEMIRVLKRDVLPQFEEWLHLRQEHLASLPISRFQALIQAIINKAYSELDVLHGHPLNQEAGDVDDERLTKLFILCLSATLNSALSIDHPYAVAFVYVGNERIPRLMCVHRSQIPGFHDCLFNDFAVVGFIRDDFYDFETLHNVVEFRWASPSDPYI